MWAVLVSMATVGPAAVLAAFALAASEERRQGLFLDSFVAGGGLAVLAVVAFLVTVVVAADLVKDGNPRLVADFSLDSITRCFSATTWSSPTGVTTGRSLVVVS